MYDHINYKLKPHFFVDNSEQIKSGYLFYKGEFLYFIETKQKQIQISKAADNKQDFISFCEASLINIPVNFWSRVKRMQ